MNVNDINVGVLAYLGDSVYELEIRNYLIKNKLGKVNDLQSNAVNYVSASSQAEILKKLLNKNVLNKEELYTINRAKNYKPNSKPKYVNIKIYKKATALEALFGMLYLENKQDRIKIIMKEILG